MDVTEYNKKREKNRILRYKFVSFAQLFVTLLQNLVVYPHCSTSQCEARSKHFSGTTFHHIFCREGSPDVHTEGLPLLHPLRIPYIRYCTTPEITVTLHPESHLANSGRQRWRILATPSCDNSEFKLLCLCMNHGFFQGGGSRFSLSRATRVR